MAAVGHNQLIFINFSCACALHLPEYSLAAFVFAVEVLRVLHLALLEAAAFLSLEAQHVGLPDILGHHLHQVLTYDWVRACAVICRGGVHLKGFWNILVAITRVTIKFSVPTAARIQGK